MEVNFSTFMGLAQEARLDCQTPSVEPLTQPGLASGGQFSYCRWGNSFYVGPSSRTSSLLVWLLPLRSNCEGWIQQSWPTQPFMDYPNESTSVKVAILLTGSTTVTFTRSAHLSVGFTPRWGQGIKNVDLVVPPPASKQCVSNCCLKTI